MDTASILKEFEWQQKGNSNIKYSVTIQTSLMRLCANIVNGCQRGPMLDVGRKLNDTPASHLICSYVCKPASNDGVSLKISAHNRMVFVFMKVGGPFIQLVHSVGKFGGDPFNPVEYQGWALGFVGERIQQSPIVG